MIDKINVLAEKLSHTAEFNALSIAKRQLKMDDVLFSDVIFFEQKERRILKTEFNKLKRTKRLTYLYCQYESILKNECVKKYLISKKEFIKTRHKIVAYYMRKTNTMLDLIDIE